MWGILGNVRSFALELRKGKYSHRANMRRQTNKSERKFRNSNPEFPEDFQALGIDYDEKESWDSSKEMKLFSLWLAYSMIICSPLLRITPLVGTLAAGTKLSN